MKSNSSYTFTLQAGATIRLPNEGNYFKLLAATGNVNVRANFGTVNNMKALQGLQRADFKWLEITDASGSANTVTIFVGDAEFIDSGTQITSNTVARSATTASYATFTPGVASQVIRSGNGVAQYLGVQNNDPAANIYIRFGTVPAVGTGLKIPPGGFYEMTNGISTFSLNMIADIAGTANSVLVITLS